MGILHPAADLHVEEAAEYQKYFRVSDCIRRFFHEKNISAKQSKKK